MINAKLFKIPKRIIIILLIVIFSIIGIVSCSGAEDITGSKDYVENPGQTGPVEPTGPEPSTPKETTFPEHTYVSIIVPWAKSLRFKQEYFTNVSWQDTNTLNNLWKAFIEGKKDNDGKRWIIRDGDNRETDPKKGNYYYFDKNLDIVHAGKYADKVRLKEFVGGVIVNYSGGRYNDAPANPSKDPYNHSLSNPEIFSEFFPVKVWTIGGLYKTVLNKEKNNSQGQQGYTKYNNDNLNEFMRAIHRWEEGDLSVILMNAGYDFGNDEYGVDEYYCTIDDNYRKNPSYFLGANPSTYTGHETKTAQRQYNSYWYWKEKLNVRVNHSWQTSEKYNFKFVSTEPYDWHLQ